MDPAPQCSVLIPAFNEERFLAGTLTSVHASFAAVAGLSYEIVVCDNNSTDATADTARTHGARVVFEPHNQIARARNTAARAACGQWLIFLDADTLLNPVTLRATVAAMDTGNAGAGGAVLRLDLDDPGSRALWVVRVWNRISRVLKLAAGSYIFCQREAWLETGGFDEELYVSEELWFSRKLKSWCRARGKKFTIITAAPIVTSARKLDWYTPGQLFRQFAIFLIPGTWKKRHLCATWYERPGNG